LKRMKKILLTFFVFFLGLTNAQVLPTRFRLGEEALRKISATTPMSNSILDIVVKGDSVWLGTSKGLSLSTDNGRTWKNFYDDGTFEKDESVTALAIGNGMVWAATGKSQEIDGQNMPVGTGLKFTTDGGDTWFTVPQPIDPPGDSIVYYGNNRLRALPITTEINNIVYDIAISKHKVFIATFAGGLRATADSGQTWQRVVLPPDYLNSIKPEDTLSFSLQPVSGAFGPENNLNHRVFSVVSNGDSLLYVGTAGGINKSTDEGLSWVKFNHLNQKNSISGNFVVALALNGENGSVWAATWKATGQTEFNAVSASFDGGENWRIFLRDEQAHNFGFKYYTSGSDVFAATDDGMYRSSDNGMDWLLPGTIKDDSTGLELRTQVFYSAAAKLNNDGTADIWLGSDNGLARLKEKNGMWQGEWKVFIAVNEREKSVTYAYPNPFAPGLENATIVYKIPTREAKVTIRIFDFGMHLVKTLLQNALRTGGKSEVVYWDGSDEYGNIVPNGVYFYRVDFGTDSRQYGKIMVLR